jgi:glutamate-1-semialdehyde 2,1-aminomutase
MPVGAYGASKEIMSHISPEGDVYQAGTLSGNPVAMAAGFAQLSECLQPGFYADQEARTIAFVNQLNQYSTSKGYDLKVFSIGSIFWFAFTSLDAVRRSDEIDPNSMNKFRVMHKSLLEKGVYLGPSGYEVGFISAAHSTNVLERAVQLICESLDVVYSASSEGITKI